VLGPLAGDLVQAAVSGMEFAASAEDIARTCHAHPAMGEAVREAALAVAGRALHIGAAPEPPPRGLNREALPADP